MVVVVQRSEGLVGMVVNGLVERGSGVVGPSYRRGCQEMVEDLGNATEVVGSG